MESPQLFQIFQELKKQSSQRNKLYPQSKDIFEFLNFDFSKLKVLILGDIPKPYNNGLWLDCTNHSIVSNELQYFYEIIEKDLYDLDFQHDRNNKSLEYLRNQGVIISSLSLVSNNIVLFRPFWELMFSEIFKSQNGLHIITFGNEVREFVMENAEPFLHNVYDLDNLTSGDNPHYNTFGTINKRLEETNGKEFTIKWLKTI